MPDTILTRLMKSALSVVTFPWEMHNRISWQYPDKIGLSLEDFSACSVQNALKEKGSGWGS